MTEYRVYRTRSTGPGRVEYSATYPWGSPTRFQSEDEAKAKVDEMVQKEYRGRTWSAEKVEVTEFYAVTGKKDEAVAFVPPVADEDGGEDEESDGEPF